MIVSEARANANRQNALKSTGPKTTEGKQRSRANALKHGLCASVVVAEDAGLVTARTDQYFRSLKPQNDFQCWLVTEIALNSLKIDRAERKERRIRDKVAMKAELTWDDDRKLEAILLGSTLSKQPELVVEQLRKNVQGCEWMMTRWAMLKHVADVDRKWTPEQTALAFDLLGTPAEFRPSKSPGIGLDFEGNQIDSTLSLADLATREIENLKERREQVRPFDEVNQALAIADLGDDIDPELKRIRRYEGTLHSRLRWSLRQFQYQSPFHETRRGLRDLWLGNPEIAPAAEQLPAPEELPPLEELPTPEIPTPPEIEPEPTALTKFDHPPFDLEPHEYPIGDAVADIPMILRNRREKKLQKAETRRDAQRRKLEKIRA